jgi:hypothetical protein
MPEHDPIDGDRIMTRVRLLVALTAVVALLPMACSDKPTSRSSANGAGDDTSSNVNIGAALFSPEPYQPVQTAGRSANPITVPGANVVILRKADVPSEVDGVVRWVGVEVDAAAAAGVKKKDLFEHPRDKKTYRRLEPGNIVRRGQVIALLEDDTAFLEHKAAATKAATAKASAIAYGGTVVELEKIVVQQVQGEMKGIVPKQEVYSSLATLARYKAERVDHEGAADMAAVEAERVLANLQKRTLKAPVDGEVQQILKQPGEGVRPTEPVLVIHDLTTLRAVGLLPKEYVNIVGRGDEVTIEMPRDVPPAFLFEQHTTNRAITAVAVTVVGGKPVVVSAAEDGWVYAWDRDLKVLGAWRQPAAVRSLAVTRKGVEPALVLVGGANGKARLYDLANPGGKEPIRELEGLHEAGGVLAAAFSPDGRFCVTSDERGIYMFDVGTGKRKYVFPGREHTSPVTGLHFTPQGKVVSAGREPSVRVWEVGADGARVQHRIDSRSGDVPMPGVTDDGSRLLLDADKTHLDIIHLEELRKERPLVTAGEAGRFTTFTTWSPEIGKADRRLIATTGTADGVIHLWRAPTAEVRGAEVARLVTRGQAAATCAAFSPDAQNGFLVVGTRKGDVHLWEMPAPDVQFEFNAFVTHVDPSIEASGRTVNVLVDFENPKDGDQFLLRPGSAVTLVIKPKK